MILLDLVVLMNHSILARGPEAGRLIYVRIFVIS